MTRRRLFDGAEPVSPTGALRILLASAAPGAVWFLHLNVSYLLVPPSCDVHQPWIVLGITVLALAAIAVAARWTHGVVRGADPGTIDHLLGFAALALAALFALATAAVGFSILVVDPCH